MAAWTDYDPKPGRLDCEPIPPAPALARGAAAVAGPRGRAG